MILDELIARFGYEIHGEENLKRFKDGMDGAVKKAQDFGKRLALAGAAAATAFAAVGSAMFKLATDAAGPLDELVKVSDRIGVAFEDLQELGFAAEQSGASTSELSSSLQSMGRQLAEAARDTGRAKLALEAYGLSATDASGEVKGTVDFLAEVADKMATLSDAQALDLGTKLGLSPAMVTMLKSGNEEIEKLRQQARDGGLIFTEKEARQAEAFNDQLNLFNRSITAIRHRIGVQFLPVLQQTISRMQGWINANQQLIRQNIELWTGRVVVGMEAAVESAGRFIRAIAAVGDRVGDLFRRLSGGEIDMSMWQSLAVVAGVLLRVFAPMWFWVTAAYLAVDELLSYLEGGESVIGDFVGWIQELTGASEPLAQTLAAIAGSLALIAAIRVPAMIGRALGFGAAGAAAGAAGAGAAAGGAAAAGAAAGTAAAKTGLAAFLSRFGLGVVGAILATPGDAKDNDYSGSDAETRARMREDARRRAEELNSGSGRGDRPSSTGPDPSRFGPAFVPAPDEELRGMLENMNGHLSKMTSEALSRSVDATITDARQDNRQFPVTVNSTVNQTVQQATQAPGAAAQATSSAVGRAAVPQRSQLETEPSF